MMQIDGWDMPVCPDVVYSESWSSWNDYLQNGKYRQSNKTIEESVDTAEKLAKDNNGVLPSSSWLQTNGFGYVYKNMFKFPELFAHIPQTPRRKTIKEWVNEAERLSNENGGVLPRTKWLKENGYKTLYQTIVKHSKYFNHIERHKERKTISEWVKVAESLAKENSGVLPSPAWLQQHRYYSLIATMQKNADMFSHIKQERFNHSLDEWIAFAEDLAKRHNGILPNAKWLINNRLIGLYKTMKKSPGHFLHIPQLKFDRQRRPI